VTRLKWKLDSDRSKLLLILMQDRCTVCAKRTIAHKSFSTHSMELQGDVGRVEFHFGPFGDSVGVGAR
jgi:hypothetical protein